MSDANSTDTPIEKKAFQSNIGVGFIVSEKNQDNIEHYLRRADQRGHKILVSCVNESAVDSRLIQDGFSAKFTLLPSAQTVTEAREILVDNAKSISLSGLIVHESSITHVDYEQCYAALEDKFMVETPVCNKGRNNHQQSIAAIIPAYNESESIHDVVLSTLPYVDDVLIIDDASTDDTGKIAKECADQIITHPKNMGVGGAVHTGYIAAARSEYDIVVQIDADGQHDPSYIPRMVELIEEQEVDMVIGSRWLNESYQRYSFLRRLGIRFFTHEVNAIAGINLTDVTSGFRAYRTSKLKNLGRPANSHWAVEQTLEAARKGWSIKEISVPMPPSVEGSQFDLETFLKYPPRMVLTTIKVLLFR